MEEVKKKSQQTNAKRNILLLTCGIVVFVLLGNMGLGVFLQQNRVNKAGPTPTVVKEEGTRHEFEYQGVDGKTALELLQQHTEVETAPSGLVIGIAKDRADDKKKEFWAFYVNGKMAEVGPAEYITKDGDLIEWKIETY